MHSTWQGLRPHYRAPDAEDLFAATIPVARTATAVADGYAAAADALFTYAAEVRGLQLRSGGLSVEAESLRQALAADPGLHSDADTAARADALRVAVTSMIEEYEAAQNACAAAVRAAGGGATGPAPLAALDAPVALLYGQYGASLPGDEQLYRPWGLDRLTTPAPDLPTDAGLPVLPPEIAVLGGIAVNVPAPSAPLIEPMLPAPPGSPDRGYTPTPLLAGPLIDADTAAVPPDEEPGPHTPIAPGGLGAHEAAGGHTLDPGRAHVGATDQQLHERLTQQPS